jgi:pimeloyl-ACP methyl ester carboxylesterase
MGLNMTEFEFTSLNERCRGRIDRFGDESAPVVVMATGGSNGGSLSDTWKRFPVFLRAAGLTSIVFDFAGQGTSDGDRRVLTLRKGVQNLLDALRTVTSWPWVNPTRVALLGSSYGGNVVLDYLASKPEIPVCGASLKSPCIDLRESYLQELGEEGMRLWAEAGYSETAGLSWQVIEEADQSDLRERLPQIAVPLLITHGVADESVPITQSRMVRDKVPGVVDLLEMNGANHHYSSGDDWERMAIVHAAWLARLFRRLDENAGDSNR